MAGKRLFHELEELGTGVLYQLLSFDVAHELPLALFQFGNHIGEVRDDALGVFIGIEQIMHLVLFEKRTQCVAGIARVAVAGTKYVWEEPCRLPMNRAPASG